MKILRNISAALMAVLMVAVSEFSGEKEIIFPEIAALLIGAWVCDKQPWEVSRIKMVALMSISAVFGVFLVRYVPAVLPVKVMIAFVFTAVSLLISKCTLLPMISACILPVIMKTESVVYPVSVLVMTAVIAFVQYMYEKNR